MGGESFPMYCGRPMGFATREHYCFPAAFSYVLLWMFWYMICGEFSYVLLWMFPIVKVFLCIFVDAWDYDLQCILVD